MAEFHRLGWALGGDVPQIFVYPKEDGLNGIICESPIEGMFAELLFKAADVHRCRVESQYVIGRYRYDFALFVGGRKKPAILIECDGAAFHSTREQIANDVRKNELAREHGIKLLRFRGTDIYRKPSICIDDVILALEGMAGKK